MRVDVYGNYLFWQGEKAYSCALCGTRFTYRNGLIKHTKLNRCPKRQNTPDSEKHNKKKNKDFGFAIHKEVNKLKISFFGGTFIQNWGYVGTGAWTLDSQCQNWRFITPLKNPARRAGGTKPEWRLVGPNGIVHNSG